MGGGDVGAAFAATLQRIGTNLTSDDLVKLYPMGSSRKEGDAPIVLSDCKYFDLFDADPVKARKETERLREEANNLHGPLYVSQIMMSTAHHPLKKMQTTDYRLKPGEKTKLAANGVVAVERMPAASFADIYYRLYTDDMPVFVTADSVLHAWHRSFDAFLVEVEIQILAPTLDKVLETTLSKCCESIPEGDANERRATLDVELFLRVARSLLRGEQVDGPGENTLKLEHLLTLVHSEATNTTEIFSAKRDVDFSQFKPRGHYIKSEGLTRYFRAMIWLGTIDFRVAGGENAEEELHQLRCAVLLVHFLREAQNLEIVARVDAFISRLVADGGMGPDALSPTQLAQLLPTDGSALGNNDLALETLEGIQNQLLQKGLGAQLINGHPRVENKPPTSTTPMIPLTSFALFGQRFIWSSFIFSRLVFEHVIHRDEKQKRRIPSAVDVAFTLFGNDSAAQILADRMNAKPPNAAAFRSPEFVPFRDGIPFSSNLVALRQLMDQEFDSEAFNNKASISMLWQRALRALSRPSPNAAGTFHSRVWQQRLMSTQLGSFTQLRHDTLLYSKQSYTMVCGCEYADGMVDPYPLFWRRMGELAKEMDIMIEKVLNPLVEFSHGQSKMPPSKLGFGLQHSDSKYLVGKSQRFFRSFAEKMHSIEEIAMFQAEHKPLSGDQVNFLKTVMEERFGSGGSKYCGWYPGLFFESREDSGKSDVIVADVHTDSPSTVHGDPGGVLHLGVGHPMTAFFAVDNVMYAGPVFSSYEFVTPIDERLADDEFERKLPTMQMPRWAHQSYLC
ncbi:hypothetical protein PHYPSEUDO_010314 [Phytophthora pseudosyringae]|uniref:Uncharacterized protein n=1 Tax=Phytophthora pseudosyringae TaxID=221518 RepID=A0A8T1VDB9_9STRA|nr:hypothetical protein PHYPSEUDO_010314 [Phytophthora pseudosyringae]